MNRYLVSYIATTAGRISYGSIEMERPEPIRSMQDVDQVTQVLRNHTGLHSAIVMGFSLLAEPADPGDPTQVGPLDGIGWRYIEQFLQEHGGPLTVEQIADRLDFPLVAVRRLTRRAVQDGRLTVTGDSYTLPGQGGTAR